MEEKKIKKNLVNDVTEKLNEIRFFDTEKINGKRFINNSIKSLFLEKLSSLKLRTSLISVDNFNSFPPQKLDLILKFQNQVLTHLNSELVISNENSSRNKVFVHIDKLIQLYDELILFSTVNEVKNLDSTLKINSIVETAESSLSEIQKLLSASKEAAAEITVSKFGVIFEDESNEHRKNAKSWLRIIFVLLGLIIVSGVAMLFYHPETVSNEMIIHIALTKLLILSAFFYALAISIKTYKAHRHNQILNKHRHNALTTFETFVGATDNDPQIKNAILLEATRTIFSPQQTGYTNADTDSDSPNKIIEIIKAGNNNSN